MPSLKDLKNRIDSVKSTRKITSAMKVRQMVRYMDAVQRECLDMGLQITDPDPDLAKYQKRYRAKVAA